MLICEDKVAIAATAHYLPPRVLSNSDLIAETGLDVSPDWIKERTGIESRHWLEKGQATSDMVVEVVRSLCARAEKEPDELSRLIVATTSPDFPTPSCACVAQGKLNVASRFPCMDVAASCSGFMYALDTASRAVLTGDSLVAVIAAEARSRFLNMRDRSTTVLFGDGAGGLLLCPNEQNVGGNAGQARLGRVLAVETFADGSGAMSVYVPAGGSAKPASHETVDANEHGLLMADGARIYMAAVEGMIEATEAVLARMGKSIDDISLLIPHQANGLMLDEIRRRLGLEPDRIFHTVDSIGNTSSSAIPVSLDMALARKRVKTGDLVSITAVGGGHTAGSALLAF